ncbi:rod shape-determining protein MreC [Blattabacterium cuenoti]|uniref:rod shape-determining protein MreC n=1 Tax=Blattabacterium cuenoti TaxID=1653831 RepID=UPI00163BE70E|nr:rod shape-determining protein MreC [Blattabacterium cuenoti]
MRRNIFHLIIQWRFIILFISLELISLLLSFSRYYNIGSSHYIIGHISESINHLRNFFLLEIENQKLIQENIKLRQDNYLSKIEKISKDFKKNNINYLQQYIYTPVKIINNSINNQENFITINKGSIDGIKIDMGVILSNGIAGIIIKTSHHFSVAISLLNTKIHINARLKKNKCFGTISWDGNSHKYVILYDIPKYSIFAKGDLVESDGKSTTFPEGIPIGNVSSYFFDKEHASYIIKVKLIEDFSLLENAYVVKNLFKQERINLQLKQ